MIGRPSPNNWRPCSFAAISFKEAGSDFSRLSARAESFPQQTSRLLRMVSSEVFNTSRGSFVRAFSVGKPLTCTSRLGYATCAKAQPARTRHETALYLIVRENVAREIADSKKESLGKESFDIITPHPYPN